MSTKQDQLHTIRMLSKQINGRLTLDVIRIGFIAGTLDQEFGEIGRLALSHRNPDMMEPHLLVWTGYEIVTESKYQNW